MDDIFDLQRFVGAQFATFEQALEEIRSGKKRSHWMWFIFPQFSGLGHSAMAQRYAIRSIEEAQAYLRDPVLGARLQQCIRELQTLDGFSAEAVFGSIDAMKLQSSLTLFEAAGASSIVAEAIDRWFDGRRDQATLELLTATTPHHLKT